MPDSEIIEHTLVLSTFMLLVLQKLGIRWLWWRCEDTVQDLEVDAYCPLRAALVYMQVR